MLVLGWRLAGRLFGLDVRNVVRIEERLRVAGLPRPVPGITAVTFLQERIVPVLDLARVMLDHADHRWLDDAKYLILQPGPSAGWPNSLFAAKVDAVVRMFTVNADDLRTWTDPPDHPAIPFVRAFVEREEGTLWLVDVHRIIRHVRGRSPSSYRYGAMHPPGSRDNAERA
jgi:chemotaxis signal transduction protein